MLVSTAAAALPARLPYPDERQVSVHPAEADSPAKATPQTVLPPGTGVRMGWLKVRPVRGTRVAKVYGSPKPPPASPTLYHGRTRGS